MQIFDFHAHSHHPEQFTAAFGLTPEKRFKKPHDYIQNYAETAEHTILETIEAYDRYNVKAGLISGPNSKQWIEQYPDRFLHSFHYSSINEKALEEFENGVNEGSIHCLGELGLAYAGLRLDSDTLYSFYEICEKNSIPVLFHTGLNGPNSSITMPQWKIENGNPIYLEQVLASFPNLSVVMAHFGVPYVDETLYMLSTYGNCYADLSVLNWLHGEKYYHRILHEAVDMVGSDRLLYGSDQMIWPQMIDRSIEQTLSAGLEKQDLENIFYNTAKSILKNL